METKRRRIEDEIERRKMKRVRDDDEFKVIEGVIDPPTLKSLYKLLSRNTFTAVHGVVSAGKEANVYRAETTDGKSLAVKIFRVSTAETDFMREYITGDPRFKRVGKRSRALVPQWALKEYKNLKRYHEAGVRVPEPLDIERNVLVMEWIGDDNGVAAPLLRNVKIASPADTYNQIIRMIELGYTKADLVHADLSEYNILWNDGPVIIDVSQAVLKGHDNAAKYLYRDIQNLTFYFNKLGVETVDPQVITRHILSKGDKSNDAS
ncbi:MAG: serine protein kinase RIO [Candidatus Thorarchaeota archaeon]